MSNTATVIIDDETAIELSRKLKSDWKTFEETGTITDWMVYNMREMESSLFEVCYPWIRDEDVIRLNAYIKHHGERGPVSGWR